MESLDDVIDAMIADRVIHRHRRKWLILITVVLVLAVVIFFLGGWKAKTGVAVDTVSAPYTVDAGRFEYGITSAKIVRTPKTGYSEAKAKVAVTLDVLNKDAETKTSAGVNGADLLLVTGEGEPLEASVRCRDDFGYKLVFGLPAVKCTAEYDVPPDYDNTQVKVGVLGQAYEEPNSLIGGDELEWQQGDALVVVQMEATVETKKS